MTVTAEAPVEVDADGKSIEVLAVRYGESPFVERIPTGELVAYREAWDADSVVTPTTRVRLLTYHDRSRPIGWLDRFWSAPDGLHASGQLVGGAAKLDELRAIVASGLAADVSVGFVPDPELDQWSPPQRRNGLAAVRRRGAKLREVSVVDLAGIPGSKVLSIRAPRPGPSSVTTSALAEAEAAARGTGVAARQRIDRQAEAALALHEADQLVEAGQRWRQLDQADDVEPAPAPTPQLADGRTWQQRLDDEDERLWHLAREDDARREYFEALARRQRAELYAEQHAAELDAVMRAHR